MAPGIPHNGLRDITPRSLFDAVADLPSSAEREAFYLLHEVPADARAEVESLLAFEAHANTFLASGVKAATEQQTANTGQRCGPFQLRRLLGQGGMGAVWLAHRVDGEVDQTVAIKLLRANLQLPKLHERFVQERRILASLSHPNIARLLDAGHTAQSQPYLVLEYVEGQPIDAYCKRLETSETLRIFLKVCAAVSHAHRNLIVHRDLKPSNILVTYDGDPKLLDFGIAKLITQDADITKTVDRMLTPEYASPEQVTGADTGTATDIYSLGAILYKLLTGRSPHQFGDPNPSGLAAVICERDVTRPSRYNPALAGDLDAILMKALRKESQERYPSVDKLAEDIEAHLDHRPVLARSGSLFYTGRRFLRRHWLAVAGPAIAILGLLAGLVVAQQQRRIAEQARTLAENQRQLAETERLDAQHQADSARREREQANRQKAVAEQRFQQLRQLTLHLLDLDQDLSRLDGATKSRQALVTTALTYLEKLREDGGPMDEAYRLELAEAYRKVADVEAGPGHPNLAQIKESLANLEKAEQLLLSAEVKDPKILGKLTENLDLQSRIAASAQEWESARLRVDRGLHALQQLRGRSEQILKWDASLSYTAQAVYVNLEQNRKAVQYGSRAAAVRGEIFRLNGTPAAESAYATAMLALATTLRYDGALHAAVEQASSGRKIFERQYQAKPDPATGRKLQWALYNEGRLIGSPSTVSLGQFGQADAVFERTLALSRQLVKADADDIASRNILASTAMELGRIRLARDPASSLALFDEAYKIRSEIPPANPAHGEKLDLLAESVRALARSGRQADAAARLERLFQALGDAHHYPGTVRAGNFAANALRAKAEAAAAAGRSREAVLAYTEMVNGFEADTERTRADLHWSLQFGELYRALAAASESSGDRVAADGWRQKDRALWVEWNRKLPGNPFVLRQLEQAGK